jgi:hypoxanthine phosphoribosyltransferase
VIDSGLSISFIREKILELEPASLRFCAFLFKSDVAKIDFKIDYVAFKIAKQFVIGYGLDLKQAKRNLKEVYKLAD